MKGILILVIEHAYRTICDGPGSDTVLDVEKRILEHAPCPTQKWIEKKLDANWHGYHSSVALCSADDAIEKILDLYSDHPMVDFLVELMEGSAEDMDKVHWLWDWAVKWVGES